MNMQYVIYADGAKKASSKKAPELMYVEFDKDTFMVHFSETKAATKDQITALGDIFGNACKGKLVQRVKQRSKNCVGFSLQNTDDAAEADKSLQSSYDELVKEAKRINAELKAKGDSGSGDSGSKGTGDSGDGKGDSGKGFDKTKDLFGRPLKESYPGLFWPGMSKAEEESAYDGYWAMVRHVDKDIFGKK